MGAKRISEDPKQAFTLSESLLKTPPICYTLYKGRGLTVLGVNEDGPRSQTKVKPFLRAHKITFRSVFDADGGLMRRMQVGSLPVTFLIAQDGEIVLRQTGYHPDVSPLAEAVEPLLSTAETGKETPGDALSEK